VQTTADKPRTLARLLKRDRSSSSSSNAACKAAVSPAATERVGSLGWIGSWLWLFGCSAACLELECVPYLLSHKHQ